MKKYSVSLLSKAKILISLILVITIVCTMALSISAADANVGYETANATVYTPMDLLSTTLSTSSESLILKNSEDSSVWKFAVNGTVLDTSEYVKPNMHKALNNSIKYSHSSDISSTYVFYGNTNTYTDNTYKYTKRSIKFTVSNNEKMTFGFTAPQNGKYEISAPISATGTNVKYAVYKTIEGNRVCLQPWQAYTASSKFCSLMVSLKAGDTVWLEATADDGAVIDIGIPRVAKQTENTGVTDKGDGSLTYSYKSADYIELAAVNGSTYGTFSATANMNGAWEYGYFKDTVSFGTTASAFNSNFDLEASAIAFNPDRTASGLKDTFIEAIANYDLMPYGDRLAAYDTSLEGATATVLGSNNATVKATSGVMIPDIANDTFTSNFRASSETTTSTEYTQYGNWFEFTAPVSANAQLLFPETNLGKYFVMVIAKNDYIIHRTVETVSSSYDLGVINEGDRITVLYYAFKATTKLAGIGFPTITLTNTYNTLNLDANGGEDSFEKYVANGTEVTLPTAQKSGYSFLGWSDGQSTYNAGDVYTVTSDTTLTAAYELISSRVDYDLDGDYDVDSTDLVILRKYLLGIGTIDEERLPFADKNDKNGIDICDLVHIRRLIAVS